MPPKPKPTFASLYCGCGGFDLGFKQAGFHCEAAFDIDPLAVSVHSLNLKSPAIVAPVQIEMATQVADVDVLLAGPPCQGFSLAGKRKPSDPRNLLLPLAAEIAAIARPKVFLLENVAGTQSGNHKKHWLRLRRIMTAAGYKTSEFSLLGTDWGVPQMRRRSMFLAWRTPGVWPDTLRGKSGGTLQRALSDLDGSPNHSPLPLDPKSRLHSIATHIGPGQKLSNVRGGDRAVHTWHIPEIFGETTECERLFLENIVKLRRVHRTRKTGDADPVPISLLFSSVGNCVPRLLKTLVEKGYLKQIGQAVDLTHTFNGKFRRLEMDKASHTVDTRFGDPRYFLHPTEQRGFTLREAARIQGFPDSFVFSGDSKANFRLIGNAVPPPMAKLIGKLIRKHLLT